MARKSIDRNEEALGNNALLVLLGAAGGAVLGYFLARGGVSMLDTEPVREAGARLRDVAEGYGPVRTPRGVPDEDALASLEDDVIDAFLEDPVLSERGIDVGCVGRGILELSGSVHSADEAERAVRLARRIDGVTTVVNRMEVDHDGRRAGNEGWEGKMGGEWTGRQVGMGQRRQSEETDPGADDSQHLREVALEASDRAQYEDEDLAHSQPKMGARPGVGEVNPTHYAEDELDNQSPYGKRAVPVAEQPQAYNSQSRVGEGLKPGTELEIEQSDVPLKPHSDEWHAAGPHDAG